ncbi:hypothetical protein SK128_013555 [Halocaridina rubra]|uniref:Uncharacterized protein n=1 Tax=Halocaridina rubra TaxID=373956 RepID=A0AAN8XKR8_HALRR
MSPYSNEDGQICCNWDDDRMPFLMSRRVLRPALVASPLAHSTTALLQHTVQDVREKVNAYVYCGFFHVNKALNKWKQFQTYINIDMDMHLPVLWLCETRQSFLQS